MHRLDRMAGWLAALCVLGGVALLVPGVFFLTAPDLASGQSGTPIGTGDVFAILSTLFVCWGIWSYARGARRRERARRRALAGELGAMPVARPLAPVGKDDAGDAEPLPLSFLWRTKRRVDGVIATEQGLIWRRGRKRDVLLPWSEARLFELWDVTLGGMRMVGYSLYGPGTLCVEWFAVHQRHRDLRPDGNISLAEMRRRERALLQLITARSGLPLRTLNPTLQREEPSEEPGAPSSLAAPGASKAGGFTRWGVAMLALLVLVPLAEAAGILLVPLTGNPLLDDFAAGTMAAVGLVVLVAEIAAYSGSARNALAAPPMLMLPTVLPQPDGIYRVRWSASGWQRVVGVLAGVALLADLAPVFAGFGGPRPSSPGTSPAFPFLAPLLPVLQVIVAFTLAGIVALGLIVACVATFEGAQVVAADAEGLSSGTGKGRETLGWQDITALLARTEGGKLESFLAVGSELEETAVAWPAAARWDGAQVAPGQAEAGYALAAVVAERTGLRWTVTPER